MARSKLNGLGGSSSRDSCSLHRWVLLKNSFLRSHSVDPEPAPSPADDHVQHVYRPDDDDSRDELEEDAHGDGRAGGSGSGSGSMSESRPTSVRVMDEKRSTPEPV